MHLDEKNELRDAIFVFRNSADSQLTAELIAKFNEHGVNLATLAADVTMPKVSQPAPLIQPQAEAPQTAAQVGATRPSPQFSKVVVRVVPEVAPTEHVVQESPQPKPVA